MESIYTYSDYRQYLSDYYRDKKKASQSFSLRVMSDKAGFKARDYILRVMNGSRNLSKSGIFMLSKALHHSEREAAFFENLVGFNQAKSISEKDHYFQKICAFKITASHQILREDQYEYFSKWYHSALRSLLPTSGCTETEASKLLSPTVPLRDVKRSIALMIHLGLLRRDEDSGEYKTSTAMLSSADDIKSVALAQFHKEALDLASQAIDKHTSEERDISGVTLSISPVALKQLKAEINEFRKRAMAIASQDSDEERVYQLEVCLFPLSKCFKSRKGQKNESYHHSSVSAFDSPHPSGLGMFGTRY